MKDAEKNAARAAENLDDKLYGKLLDKVENHLREANKLITEKMHHRDTNMRSVIEWTRFDWKGSLEEKINELRVEMKVRLEDTVQEAVEKVSRGVLAADQWKLDNVVLDFNGKLDLFKQEVHSERSIENYRREISDMVEKEFQSMWSLLNDNSLVTSYSNEIDGGSISLRNDIWLWLRNFI